MPMESRILHGKRIDQQISLSNDSRVIFVIFDEVLLTRNKKREKTFPSIDGKAPNDLLLSVRGLQLIILKVDHSLNGKK